MSNMVGVETSLVTSKVEAVSHDLPSTRRQRGKKIEVSRYTHVI